MFLSVLINPAFPSLWQTDRYSTVCRIHLLLMRMIVFHFPSLHTRLNSAYLHSCVIIRVWLIAQSGVQVKNVCKFVLFAGVFSFPSPSVTLWIYVPAHNALDAWKIIACYWIKLYTEVAWWFFSSAPHKNSSRKWLMFPNHWLDFAPVEILLKKLNLTEMPSLVFFADYYFMVYSRGLPAL